MVDFREELLGPEAFCGDDAWAREDQELAFFTFCSRTGDSYKVQRTTPHRCQYTIKLPCVACKVTTQSLSTAKQSLSSFGLIFYKFWEIQQRTQISYFS
jgi:hypothetical protein